MSTLLLFVIGYIFLSIAVGVYAATKVKNSTDYILAGRSLPIHITIATVFATWFGSEAVLGIPSTFLEEGLAGTVADPFGAGFCLIFVGLFFAQKLYRAKVLTIADFYRKTYGRIVEVPVSLFICISYLGWVAAQIVALGLTLSIVTQGALSAEWGMVVGLTVVMFYTVVGGMWAVSYTDFMQMSLILVGLVAIAVLVSGNFEGGALEVVNHAHAAGKFQFWPEWSLAGVLGFMGAFVTLALGSIPQQDVFQRVMSAKNEKTAVRGTILGGSFYVLFCFIPIFIAYAATLQEPALLATHLSADGDTQRLLPEFILMTMPLWVQILFFGALISAIMSTASGTLLAPSVILAENIFKDLFGLSEKSLLLTLRLSVLFFGLIVLGYAYLSASAGLSIFEMVENAYLVTLCGAFVPLLFGVYWKKASTGGALTSIVLGVGTWVALEIHTQFMAASDADPLIIPAQLAGLFAAFVGMVVGSLVFKKPVGSATAAPIAAPAKQKGIPHAR